MRPSSVYTSFGLHIVLAIIATVSLPWIKKDFIVPPPVMVEFVEVSQITQTNKVAPAPIPKPEEKKPEEQPPPPPQPAQNTAKDMTPPTPEPEVKEEKPEPKKEEKPEIDPNAMPDKKKPAEKPKEKKKEEKKPEPKIERQKDFSSVLKNLAVPKTPTTPTETPEPKAKDASPSAAQNAPLGEKMTVSEEDLLRRQLEGCWNVPVGAKDAENLNIEIAIVVNPDRTLREAKVVDTSRYNSDTFFRAAAESALRAVRNPLCSPFQLPPDKYDTWKNITVNFNPSQMF